MERAKQIGQNRFGVLFTELHSAVPLRQIFDENGLNQFLQEIATHLKTILRPTDTISRFHDGLFLILLEDILNDEVPSSIAKRVKKELGKTLFEKQIEPALQVSVGVVLCNAAYKNTQEILADIDFARRLVKFEKEKILYDRNYLQVFRGSFANS